jgi:basic membrane protein A
MDIANNENYNATARCRTASRPTNLWPVIPQSKSYMNTKEELNRMRNHARLYGIVALVLVTAMMLVACAVPVAVPAAPAAATEAPAAEAAAPAADVKLGLVTDVGRINDRSFNQSTWEGVVQAGQALGLTEGDGYKYIETVDVKDYADNIQQFVDAGYNAIVTVGFALAEATNLAAAENPDIFFVGVDQFQGEALPNVAGLVFNEDKAGFLAGALAAYLSKTGTVAQVLGTDLVPPVVAFGVGFENGAKYVNPDINVITTYHPGEISQSFVDPEWGAATAKQALDNGADIVFGAGGMTGNGALQEVASAPGAGTDLFCIGVDTDQWETLPAAHPCLVSSAMKLLTPSTADLLTKFAGGEMTSGNYFGATGLAPFHDFEDVVPQDVKDALVALDAGLKDGSVSTGYAP